MQQINNTGIFRFIFLLWSLIAPYRCSFLAGMLALFLGSAMNLSLPKLAQYVIDADFQAIIIENPASSALIVAALFAMQNLFFYFRSYFFTSVGIHVAGDIRTSLFGNLIRSDLSFHDTSDWADLRSRLLNDVQLIQDAVSQRLSVFLRYAIQVLIGALMMLWISPHLAMVAICIIPPLTFLGAAFGKRLKSLSRSAQETMADLSRDIEDGIGQIRLIKTLAAEDSLIVRFRRHSSLTVEAAVKRARFAGFFSSFVNFLLNTSLLFVVLYGLYLVSISKLSNGDLTAFLLYGTIVAVSFAFVISSYTELIQASVAAERIFSVKSALPDSVSMSAGFPASSSAATVGDEIRLESVSFSYPSRPDYEVISDLSFVCPPNSCTAIVGASGGGKSTLVNLILGLYKSSRGELYLNGTPFSNLDVSLLRSRIAVVHQDSPLISGSIRDNLLLGNENRSEDEILKVLNSVNLSEFVQLLPAGLDTALGERGTQISGGQRQRLAIARALLRAPSTLILDEATSALDAENEKDMIDILSRIKHQTTLIIISHRLSTISIAERVIVLKKGEIAQQGSYQEVVSSAGLFRSMIETAEVEGS